ncbi:hypothetical protein BJ742DRAFT_768340 [Cladochytrium replicatum]|nr:hypothetical protein BJ742DRAFT_768340 [Cladochytrium replicatum]
MAPKQFLISPVAIASIVVLGVLGLACVGGICFCFSRRRLRNILKSTRLTSKPEAVTEDPGTLRRSSETISQHEQPLYPPGTPSTVTAASVNSSHHRSNDDRRRVSRHNVISYHEAAANRQSQVVPVPDPDSEDDEALPEYSRNAAVPSSAPPHSVSIPIPTRGSDPPDAFGLSTSPDSSSPGVSLSSSNSANIFRGSGRAGASNNSRSRRPNSMGGASNNRISVSSVYIRGSAPFEDGPPSAEFKPPQVRRDSSGLVNLPTRRDSGGPALSNALRTATPTSLHVVSEETPQPSSQPTSVDPQPEDVVQAEERRL